MSATSEKKPDNVFTIKAEKKGDFEKYVAKITKRAGRMGLPAPTVSFGEPYVRDSERVYVYSAFNERRVPIKIQVIDVTVTGEMPVYQGWRFVAYLQPADTNNAMMIHEHPQFEGNIPARFSEYDTGCDHCQLRRNRKDLFIVQNVADGTFMRVGKSCLEQFTGEGSTRAVVWGFSSLAQIIDCRELSIGWDFIGGGGTKTWVAEAIDVLAMAEAVIRQDGGYVSYAVAESHNFEIQSTKDRVFDQLTSDKPDVVPTREDALFAQEAMAWVEKSFGQGGDHSGYELNMVSSIKGGFVHSFTAGVAVSIIPTYRRHLNKLEEIKAREQIEINSGHVGELKQRLEGVHVRLLSRFGTNSFNHFTGQTEWKTGHKFVTTGDDQVSAGNILMWWTTSEGLGEEGDDLVINCTVARHGQYNGVLQTNVNRVAKHKPKKKRTRQPKASATVQAPGQGDLKLAGAAA